MAFSLLKRTRDPTTCEVLSERQLRKQINKVVKNAKKRIEKCLDKRIKDTTENVLRQIEYNGRIEAIAVIGGSIDDITAKINSFLSSILC